MKTVVFLCVVALAILGLNMVLPEAAAISVDPCPAVWDWARADPFSLARDCLPAGRLVLE